MEERAIPVRALHIIFLAAMTAASPAWAGPGWFSCTAWGGSHTGRYTFRINPSSCEVFWKEVDRTLAIDECAPPYIVARKPFALNDEYVLRFNLESGAFADSVSGWTEFGECRESKG